MFLRLFEMLGIGGSSIEERVHRRDFWIGLFVLSIILLAFSVSWTSSQTPLSGGAFTGPYMMSDSYVLGTSDADCLAQFKKTGQVCFTSVSDSSLAQLSTYFEKRVSEITALATVNKSAIIDGGFENGTWAKEVGDCCVDKTNNVSFAWSTDAYAGNRSVSLISTKGCACVSTPLQQFSNKSLYLISFAYKGDAPKFCIWTSGDFCSRSLA